MSVWTAVRRGIELKVGMGVGDGATKFVGIFSKRPHLGQTSSRGQSALKCPMATNFIEKNPWPQQSVLLGQKSCGGHLGSTKGQIA